jgi:hypothetical protein
MVGRLRSNFRKIVRSSEIMLPSDEEKWARARRLGRKRFVWLYGVLGWGVPTAILFSILRAYAEGWEQLPVILAISLAIFPLGGIVFGRVMWRCLERMNARSPAASSNE